MSSLPISGKNAADLGANARLSAVFLMDRATVEVAAAVLLRDRRGLAMSGHTPGHSLDFLLACRPVGKVYAGHWEFPGGKVEPGEMVYQALARELEEEMGIRVTTANPWLHKRFIYPHATVHLNFWRVTAWEGEIEVDRPLEHQAIAWLPMGDALHAEQHLSPILPANGSILKALALPTRCLITQAATRGVFAETERLRMFIKKQGGGALLQVRERSLPVGERLAFLQRVLALTRPAGMPVVVNVDTPDELALVTNSGADGVHLSSRFLAHCVSRPDFFWVGASCHQSSEVRKAGALGLDYALLGPVKVTLSHPATMPLGWEGFSACLNDNHLPVFALGGLDANDLGTAWANGGHGIATLRAW